MNRFSNIELLTILSYDFHTRGMQPRRECCSFYSQASMQRSKRLHFLKQAVDFAPAKGTFQVTISFA